MKKFHANGKLLISGEYLVLNGALSLAIPTKKGQSLQFESNNNSFLEWESLDENGTCWFDAQFSSNNLKLLQSSDQTTANKLKKILQKGQELSNQEQIFKGKVTTQLEFPINWGLGSSSTLISCIAHWLKIDPFKLHFEVSNGSGYDIACAENNIPITYQLIDQNPVIKSLSWNPSFHESLFFVYLNTKQNSNNEVERFIKNTNNIDTDDLINKISEITNKLIDYNELHKFCSAIEEHEHLMSKILDIPTLKENKFPNYPGSIKSLGAWGGDFILATGGLKERDYFKSKGYNVQLEFKEMIK